MKKRNIAILMTATFVTATSFAQNNTFPTPTGNVGIGTTTPNFNLQLHGTTNYSVTFPSTPGYYDINGNFFPGTAGYTANYGITSRLGFTNTNTGLTSADGMLIRMSGLNGTIENLEKQDLTLSTSGSNMRFSGSSNRIFAGNTPGVLTASNYAYFNIASSDNGIYIQNNIAGKFGLSLKMHSATDNAIQVMGYGAAATTVRNFSVKANGEVFARKYTTTLNNIPDYVFKADYNLMPLNELRTYIKTNSHLPNIPSAKEMEASEVDLGEMNRLLLEKTEELTLYILQLEERIKSLESSK
jgi:hypothetical protein